MGCWVDYERTPTKVSRSVLQHVIFVCRYPAGVTVMLPTPWQKSHDRSRVGVEHDQLATASAKQPMIRHIKGHASVESLSAATPKKWDLYWAMNRMPTAGSPNLKSGCTCLVPQTELSFRIPNTWKLAR